MSLVKAARVQRKVLRFLNSSGIFRTHKFTIRVATSSKYLMAQIAKVVRELCRLIGEVHFTELGIFFASRMRVVQTAPPTVAQSLPSHIQAARFFSVAELADVTEDEFIRAYLRHDVQKYPHFWNVPTSEYRQDMKTDVLEQLREMLVSCNLSDFSGILHTHFDGLDWHGDNICDLS
eukprot:9476686-Pyramimonas_sp.AAC.1